MIGYTILRTLLDIIYSYGRLHTLGPTNRKFFSNAWHLEKRSSAILIYALENLNYHDKMDFFQVNNSYCDVC